MTLYIDTTDYDKVTFAVSSGKKITKKSYKINPHQSNETLSKLDEFLGLIRNSQSLIRNIVVNKGPGSFTGVRVGVTHALALAYTWNVPLKAVAKEKFKIGK